MGHAVLSSKLRKNGSNDAELFRAQVLYEGFPNPGERKGRVRAAKMVFMATQNPKKPEIPVAPPSVGNDDSVVLERRTQRTKPPQMYQVVLLNDDFTPMEFVVHVIQEYFSKDREMATQIMLKIHLEGKGICGVYSRDVAGTKVDQVAQAARHAGHPLQCLSEPIE
jgi:ATP-dependent Clp protease adaptor protein ClpS